MSESSNDLPSAVNLESAKGQPRQDQAETGSPVESSLPLVSGEVTRGLTHSADPDLVMGVDRKLLEKFLTLIRDHYEKVEKATFFLEMRTGKINVSGIKNVRGILSHLVMLLEAGTPPENRAEQLVNAEGHMRRAITEPYEVALDSLTVAFEEIYERYKKEVLPVSEKHGPLRSAPNSVMVEARLHEVRDLGSKGREATSKNLWNPDWEYGASCLVDAFDKLFTLKSEIETYCNAYDSLQESKRFTRLHLFGIAIGILGIVAAVLSVVIPGFPEHIRSFFRAILDKI